jgi:hypothetical protein
VILVVRLDGLDGLSAFHDGEARVHGDIARERLTVYESEVIASWEGFGDPALTERGNHPACARRDGFESADDKEW